MLRNFTTEELIYFEAELRKFKSPWFSKLMFAAWFKFMRYMTKLLSLILLIEIIWYSTFTVWNSNADTWWFVIEITAFYLIFRGLLMLIAYLLEKLKIKIESKKLGLTIEEWNFLILTFKIIR